MTFDLPNSFWAKVRIDTATDCWLWDGATSTVGYGRFKFDGRLQLPHRLSYEANIGSIPPGLVIDHTCHDPEVCAGGDTCRHRRCVNPSHLEPVTRRVNSERSGHVLSTQNSAKTHCPQGHPYDLLNTYVNPRGHRDCRTCRHANNVRRAAVRKAARAARRAAA